MATIDTTQFIRKIGLLVGPNQANLTDFRGINLSDMRIRFNVNASDVETPNNAEIRVYNLSPQTVKQVLSQSEFTNVLLQAGYANGAYGIIFRGTVRQLRWGKEDATSTYLDLLCADGDIPYNEATLSSSNIPGQNNLQKINSAAEAAGVSVNTSAVPNATLLGGIIPRGKVQFGMFRDAMRDIAAQMGCSWSIQNGVVTFTPFSGYQNVPIVNLSTFTGIVGVPEQTDQGIKVKCLLNPLLQIGGVVVINNAQINQTITGKGNVDQVFSGVPFNQRAGEPQLLASIANDGHYRVYCVEHVGDIRGQEWYSNVIMLSIDPTTKSVIRPPQ
jgi:hypothetical protein